MAAIEQTIPIYGQEPTVSVEYGYDGGMAALTIGTEAVNLRIVDRPDRLVQFVKAQWEALGRPPLTD